jgi:hypothetical protein
MAVALYGTRGDAALGVREECYAWSLPNIDGMVASTIVVTNDGTRAVPHAHVGVALEAAPGSKWATRRRSKAARHPRSMRRSAEKQVVFDDDDRGLGGLMLIPRAQMSGDAGGWQLQDDHSRVGGIARSRRSGAGRQRHHVSRPGGASGRRSQGRARHSQRAPHHRGDGNDAFHSASISVMARNRERDGSRGPRRHTAREGGSDPFWITPGKLQETLLVGLPNPFRDTMSIDYEIPHRVVDEDGASTCSRAPASPPA